MRIQKSVKSNSLNNFFKGLNDDENLSENVEEQFEKHRKYEQYWLFFFYYVVKF